MCCYNFLCVFFGKQMEIENITNSFICKCCWLNWNCSLARLYFVFFYVYAYGGSVILIAIKTEAQNCMFWNVFCFFLETVKCFGMMYVLQAQRDSPEWNERFLSKYVRTAYAIAEAAAANTSSHCHWTTIMTGITAHHDDHHKHRHHHHRHRHPPYKGHAEKFIGSKHLYLLLLLCVQTLHLNAISRNCMAIMSTCQNRNGITI